MAVSTGVAVEIYSAKCQATHCLTMQIEEDEWNVGLIFHNIEQGAFELCFVGRLMLLGLAPLADDARLTRLILLWDAYVFAHTRVSMLLMNQATISDDLFGRASLWSYYGRGVAFVLCAVVAICQRKPQEVQAMMWAAVGVYAVWNAVDKAGRTVYEAIHFHHMSGCIGQIFADAAVLYVIGKPELRQRLQGKLRSWLESRAAVRAAVTIACLIGGCQPREAVAQATARFRCVSCGDLSFEDVKDNTPDADLHKLSVLTQLGYCDAFISHSWHDDAEAKWQALQRWRFDFVAKAGREPLIWFDKVCIDQNNIDLDLRCLPIFLSGCARLVMLCGATYLSRLWCITEVFAYVHMGCKIENIKLVPVLRESMEDEDLDDIHDAFRAFDVRACNCFNQEDKERMMIAIQTAFGCMDKFNCVVQKISRCVTQGSATERKNSDDESSIPDLGYTLSASSSEGSSSGDTDEEEKSD